MCRHAVFPSDLGCMDTGEDYILTVVEQDGGQWFLFVGVCIGGKAGQSYKVIGPECTNKRDECERLMAYMMYQLLKPITGKSPGWGILTGIRPVKLFHKRLDSGISPEETGREFKEKFLVSSKKINLALQTAAKEGPVLKESRPNHFSLYVSVPFCPTAATTAPLCPKLFPPPRQGGLSRNIPGCFVRKYAVWASSWPRQTCAFPQYTLAGAPLPPFQQSS